MSVSLRANAVRDAVDVRASDVTTPQFFVQALRSLADRLGSSRFVVLVDDHGNETRISGAQLYRWAQLGPSAIEVEEIPYGSHHNFAMLCDDLSSQHDSWRSLRRGDLRICDAQFRQAYVTPAVDSSGHLPRSTPFQIDVVPTAAAVAPPRAPRTSTPPMTEADAMTRVTHNPAAYETLPAGMRANHHVCLAAMSQPRGGEYLHLVPVALRTNDVVRAAVVNSQNGRALMWATPEQKSDVGFVRSLFVGTTHPIDISWVANTVAADPVVRQSAFDALIPLPHRGRFSAAQREAYLSVIVDGAPASTAAARDPVVAGALLAFARDGDFDTGLGLATMSNIDTWAQQARIRGTSSALINQMAALTAAGRTAIATRVSAAHIACWERFATLADLEGALADFEHRNDTTRPVLLLIASRDDHNGAVARDLANARAAFPGYRVVYREASSQEEFLSELAAQRAHPAEIVIATGHGNRTSLTMGPQGTAHRDLDRSLLHHPRLAAAQHGVARGGRIYTIGCSNGEGGRNDGNMVNTFAAAFPNTQAAGARVSSETMRRRGDSLSLDVSNPRLTMYVVPPLTGATVLPMR